MCARANMWTSEDNSQQSLSSIRPWVLEAKLRSSGLAVSCLHLPPSLFSPHYDILVQRCHCILLLSLTTLLLPTTPQPPSVYLSAPSCLNFLVLTSCVERHLPALDCAAIVSYHPLSPPNPTGSGCHWWASSSNGSASIQLLPHARVRTTTGSNAMRPTSQAPPLLSVKALGRARELVPPCALFIYQETWNYDRHIFPCSARLNFLASTWL